MYKSCFLIISLYLKEQEYLLGLFVAQWSLLQLLVWEVVGLIQYKKMQYVLTIHCEELWEYHTSLSSPHLPQITKKVLEYKIINLLYYKIMFFIVMFYVSEVELAMTDLRQYLKNWDPLREIWETDRDLFISRYEKANPSAEAFNNDIGK